MKTINKIKTAAMVLAAVMPIFAACSKDTVAEDDYATDSPPPSILVVDGKRLGHVGHFSIRYDSRGRVRDTYYGTFKFAIDYERGLAYTSMFGLDNPAKIEFDERGCITSIHGWIKGIKDGISFDYDREMTYSYDEDGHLARIAENISLDEVYETEGTHHSTDTCVVDLIWEDGNMIRAEVNDEITFDGSEDGTSSYTVHYQYGDQKNEHRQFVSAIALTTLGYDYGLEELAAAGMFGTGTETFPTEYKMIDAKPTAEPVMEWGRFTYETNPNGTISKEKAFGILQEWLYFPIDNPVKVK